MTFTSDPPPTLYELWRRGTSLPEAYAAFAQQQGRPIGLLGVFQSVLQLIASQLEIIAKNQHNSKDLFEQLICGAGNWQAQNQSIAPIFRNRLVRKLNAGKCIALGYRVYSPKRRVLKYVWDGRLHIAQFDWENGGYCGLQKQFEDIRILDCDLCPDYQLKKFARKRAEKTGRPEIEEIRAVIAHAAANNSAFFDPSYHKKAVYDVHCALAGLVRDGELATMPAETTIAQAIRVQRRSSN